MDQFYRIEEGNLPIRFKAALLVDLRHRRIRQIFRLKHFLVFPYVQ